MKQLTICQPYAHLIITGRKRVENRTWATGYRGPLLIHAGKARNWLELNAAKTRDDGYDIALADMAFGAIVGICDLSDCVRISLPSNAELRRQDLQRLPAHLAWMRAHPHTEGPHCMVLTNVRRLVTPLPYRGALGLSDVPDDLLEGLPMTAVAEVSATPPALFNTAAGAAGKSRLATGS